MSDFITIADTPLAGLKRRMALSEIPGWMLNDGITEGETPVFGDDWLGVRCSTQAEYDERVPDLLRQDARRFVLLSPREAVKLWEWSEWDGRFNGPAITHDYRRSLSTVDGPGETEGESYPGVDFVIVQGGDTPVHPAWVRSIRDACVAAGVPFHFAGWGEWTPPLASGVTEPSDEWGVIDFAGSYLRFTTPWNGRQDDPEDNYEFTVRRVGADKSGRLLDGREWVELPGEATS